MRQSATEGLDGEPVFEEVSVAPSDIPPTTAVFLSGVSDVGEGLRAVGTQLRMGRKGKPIRTLAVVSSVEGDGKTCVALGLAAAVAHTGQRVLLIDADLRRRDLCPALGVEPTLGLAEWLERGRDVLPVRRVSPAGFSLLAAGVASCRPELLGTPRFAQLLNTAERHFDLVILDCAPLLPVADTLALRDQVGGFLMVVRARRSPREAISRAVALLGRSRVVGMVMNAYHRRVPTSRGYAYGYGSSYRYGPRYSHRPVP